MTYNTKNSMIENLNEIYEKYFGYPSRGYFVEVGAYDGEFASNTSCLADNGWSGLYIEPIYDHYLRCVDRHKNNNVDVVNCAIGLDEGETTIYYGNTLTTLDKEQVKRYSEIDWASHIQFSETKCNQIRLDNLLTQKGVPKEFDVLVVDVEGKEFEVFQTFNLNEWKPKVLIIELEDEHPSFQNYPDLVEKIKILRQSILKSGYIEVEKNIIDTVFVRSDLFYEKNQDLNISSKTITVVLNGYKRNNLKEQVEAIKNQTVPVKEILYWQNTVPGFSYDEETYSQLNSALSNYNYGVWARFAYALNARTDYVCVFDDDTIPGPRWLENCLKTYETHPGLLGGIGLRFKNARYEFDTLPDGRYCRYGWDGAPWNAGNNVEPVQVDIVGHSWFFSRDLLSVFWRELPDERWTMVCGEDIHFSHMLQKYTNLKTWVPPHPPNDPSMWSSLKGMLYGDDHNATFNITKQTGEMSDYLEDCVNNGFKLYKDLNPISTKRFKFS